MKTKIILTILFVLMAGFVIGFVAGWSAAQKEAPRMEQDAPTTAPSDTLSEWQALTLAIAITESKCNPSATGKTNDGGLLQITPVYVREANRLAGTDYTHEDSYDIGKSLAMFRIIQDHYNPERSVDKAIRLHNPGGNALNYAHKVQSNILFIQRLEAARKAVLEQNL